MSLPFESVKSKQLQAQLGVKSAQSAKKKLVDLGAVIIKDEYVVLEHLKDLMEQKTKAILAKATDNTNINTDESYFSEFLK